MALLSLSLLLILSHHPVLISQICLELGVFDDEKLVLSLEHSLCPHVKPEQLLNTILHRLQGLLVFVQIFWLYSKVILAEALSKGVKQNAVKVLINLGGAIFGEHLHLKDQFALLIALCTLGHPI